MSLCGTVKSESMNEKESNFVDSMKPHGNLIQSFMPLLLVTLLMLIIKMMITFTPRHLSDGFSGQESGAGKS